MADNAQMMPRHMPSAGEPAAAPFAALLADLGAPALEEAPQLPLAALDSVPGRSRLLVQLLHNRGFSDAAAIDSFLTGDWRSPGPPLLHLDRAVARVRRAIAEGERIVVYGDFDCDGITSCALLALALRALGAQVDTYVPRRDDDGRGLNVDAVRELAAAGARLILTTDCGTANVEETALARTLGVDVIVTDHHPPHGPMAPAYAIVNPRQAGDTSGAGDLAGAGVAFRFAQALLADADDAHAATLEALVELVAIGTIADVVPLTPANWALARAGLRRMNEGPRPGVRALLETARVDAGNVVARDISFALAPRLNACGRMGEPDLAVRILMAEDLTEARGLARRIEMLNLDRQALTDRLLTAARAQAEAQRGSHAALVAVGDQWPLGVIGLVAGQLAEAYQRPAFVISRDGDECRGSARGPGGVNLGELLATRADFFKRFGGHAQAAGFTLATTDLEAFLAYLRERFTLSGAELEAARHDGDGRGARVVRADCRLRLNRLLHGSSVFADLETLQPFGAGFAEPVFLSPDLRITRCRRSGPDGRTLRLTFSDGHGAVREAIWPRRGEFCERIRALLSLLPSVDVAYTLRPARALDGAVFWRMHIETLAAHG